MFGLKLTPEDVSLVFIGLLIIGLAWWELRNQYDDDEKE